MQRSVPLLPVLLLVVIAASIACTSKERAPARLEECLAVWLDAPAEVVSGETVPLSLNVKNTTDAPLQLFFGGDFRRFRITDENGQLLWYWPWVLEDYLALRVLQPGQTNRWDKELPDLVKDTIEWSQEDMQGNPVSPGVYYVQGVLRAALPEDPDRAWRENPDNWHQVEVGPRKLVILP